MTGEEREAIPSVVEAAGEASGPEPPLLDVGEYGEAMAHLAHFEQADPAEVLSRLSVSAALWEATHATWSARLRAELRSGETEPASTFAQAFAAKKSELDTEQPALESIGELPAQETSPSEVSQEVHATGEPPRATLEAAPERGEAVPSELPAAVAPSPMPIRPRSSRSSSSGSSSSRPSPWAAGRAESPGAADAPSSKAPVKPPPADPPRDAPPPAAGELAVEPSVDETVLGVSAIESDPLPFTDRPNPELQAKLRERGARPLPVHDQVGETQEVSALLAEGPTLPFEPATSRPRKDVAESAPSAESVDETVAVSVVLDPEPALPFTDEPTAPRQEPREPPPERDLAGETQEVSAVLSRGFTLPFARPRTEPANSDAAIELDLHQYASIRAELAVHPDGEAQVFARYGLADASAFAALDAAWVEHLATHPEDRSKLNELVPRFCAWLEKQEKGSKS